MLNSRGGATMKTYGVAAWQGGIKDGKGAISTRSGALKEYPLEATLLP
jgi:hypothetical protein